MAVLPVQGCLCITVAGVPVHHSGRCACAGVPVQVLPVQVLPVQVPPFCLRYMLPMEILPATLPFRRTAKVSEPVFSIT